MNNRTATIIVPAAREAGPGFRERQHRSLLVEIEGLKERFSPVSDAA
jgi:hypothetical protein